MQSPLAHARGTMTALGASVQAVLHGDRQGALFEFFNNRQKMDMKR